MLNNTTTMSTTKSIQSALISVFDKTGLEPIVRQLHQQNATIYSTGGTEDFIKSLGIPVVPVEDITAFPEILGGRVKTLHPKIFLLGLKTIYGHISSPLSSTLYYLFFFFVM